MSGAVGKDSRSSDRTPTEQVTEILAGPPPEGAWVTSSGEVHGSGPLVNPIPNLLAELVADNERLRIALRGLRWLLDRRDALEVFQKEIADYRDGLEDGGWDKGTKVYINGIIHDLTILLDRSTS